MILLEYKQDTCANPTISLPVIDDSTPKKRLPHRSFSMLGIQKLRLDTAFSMKLLKIVLVVSWYYDSDGRDPVMNLVRTQHKVVATHCCNCVGEEKPEGVFFLLLFSIYI